MSEVSKAVLLASAVMSLVGRLKPDQDLAPKDENEDPLDHSLRLIEAVQDYSPEVINVDGGTLELDTLTRGLGERGMLEGEDDDAQERALLVIDQLGGQVVDLNAEVEKLKAQKSTAQKRARAAEGTAPAKARKIGEIVYGEKNPRPSGDELRELMADAETVEIVLSDGKSEIGGVLPRQITGPDAWVDIAAGLKLNVPELIVHGPGLGDQQHAYQVMGYGLVVDGKQVAWSARPEQLTIGMGQQVNLKDDVIF